MIKKNSNIIPCNIEAEQNILGLLLANNEGLYKINEFLRPEYFYFPIHAKIYIGIVKLIEKGFVASIISIKNYFKKEKIFEELGTDSQEYLIKIFCESKLNIDIYTLAKNIQDTYIRRKIININERYILKAQDETIEQTAKNILDQQEQELFVLRTQNSVNVNCFALSDSLKQAIKRIEKAKIKNNLISGIDTGYYDLNEYTGGLQKSDLIIVAGRPSMGKTSFVINIAINIAKIFVQDKNMLKTIALFSLEMSSEQIASRILSMETKIDGSKIKSGKMTQTEMNHLAQNITSISELPIFIDDTPAVTISIIKARARKMKRQNKISLLIVDYLQLVKASNISKDNRVQEIGEISQGLKAIAKDLDIPVIAVSQLSRAVENRDDKRPLLSDLRESGNIEQDADLVMLIYREEYYLARKRPIEDKKLIEWQDRMEKVGNIAEINIAKQRNGPVGSFFLKFNNSTTSFENLN